MLLYVLYWIFSSMNMAAAAATAKSLQSCLTLCDPIDSSSPSSPVPGILQVRALEWVAISFSNRQVQDDIMWYENHGQI